MSAPLIGLTGAAGAGKDEVGKILARAGWRGLSFAAALRTEVSEAWAFPIAVLSDRIGKEKTTPQLTVDWCQSAYFRAWCEAMNIDMRAPRSPRWAMQTWGTWRRSQNPLHWINHVAVEISNCRHTRAGGVVITDVRMPNEANMLASRGGHLVRVHRPDLPALPPDTAGHESERHTELASAAEIHNDGTLEHLQAEVWRVVQQLAAQASSPARATP